MLMSLPASFLFGVSELYFFSLVPSLVLSSCYHQRRYVFLFISKSCILRVPAITNEEYTLVYFSSVLLCVPLPSVSGFTTGFHFFLKFNQLQLIPKGITASRSCTRQTVSQHAKHTRESPDSQPYSQLHPTATRPPISRRRSRGRRKHLWTILIPCFNVAIRLRHLRIIGL